MKGENRERRERDDVPRVEDVPPIRRSGADYLVRPVDIRRRVREERLNEYERRERLWAVQRCVHSAQISRQ